MDHRSPQRRRSQKKGNKTSTKAESRETFPELFPELFWAWVGRAQSVPKCTDTDLLTPGHFLEQLLDSTEKQISLST